MREYGIVSPKFWIGNTGKLFRGDPAAQIVALYLMTCPTSTMTGLFYCSLVSIAHETGLGEKGASKGLRRAIEGAFCEVDEKNEVVFVVKMAEWQIGMSLKAEDKRVAGIRKEIEKVSSPALQRRFLEVYDERFQLQMLSKLPSPFEGASKALRSQEQEQEQERAKDTPIVPKGTELSDSVISVYHEALPNCKRIAVSNPKRLKRIEAVDKLARKVCAAQGWEYDTPTFWAAYFAKCAEDPWMRGDVPHPNNPRWKQSLDVLIREDRFADVMDSAIASMQAAS